MNRSLIISSVLHGALIFITAMSLPFLAKKPIDIPPIVSVELIQIAEKTNIPFAPKAKKIIEKKKKKKLKEKEKKLVSEQAPPKKVKKSKTKTIVSLDNQKEKIDNQKPEAIPLPDKTVKKIEKKKETRQNPEKVDNEVKQVSEFEKKDLFDPSNIAALIDKSKIEEIDNIKKNNDITQDQYRLVYYVSQLYQDLLFFGFLKILIHILLIDSLIFFFLIQYLYNFWKVFFYDLWIHKW